MCANDPSNLKGDEEKEEKEEHRNCREFHLTHYYKVPLHPKQILQRPSIRTISAFFWRNILLLSFILRYIIHQFANGKDLFGSFFQIKSTTTESMNIQKILRCLFGSCVEINSTTTTSIKIWIFKRFCYAVVWFLCQKYDWQSRRRSEKLSRAHNAVYSTPLLISCHE